MRANGSNRGLGAVLSGALALGALGPGCSTINAPADGGNADAAGEVADAGGGDARRDVPVIGPGGDAGVDARNGGDAAGTDVIATQDVPAVQDVPPAQDVPTDANNCPADLPPPPTGEPACASACPDHAHCLGGTCQCDPGFDPGGAGCVPQAVSDPATHSDAEMCDRWAAGHVEDASDGYVEGTACNCDPGTMTRVQRNDMLRRLNMFRWFVGLGPVSDDEDMDRSDQYCALMEWKHGWGGGGSDPHHPTMDWECYSAAGAGAAGSSNLAWGPRTAADSIDGFMDDGGNGATMGHRRWFLHPPLGPVGVGHWGGATCVGVFSSGGGGPEPMWYAYPPPGAYLRYKFTGEWTFQTRSYLISDTTDFVVTRVADGSQVTGRVWHLPYGYGDDAIGFEPNGIPAAGETWRITITGLGNFGSGGSGTTDVSYEIHGVDCP